MGETKPLRGQIIGEETVISLDELCEHCTLQAEEVVTMVREGIIDPAEGLANSWPDAEGAVRWRFHISSVRRVRTAVRLQRDLGVNLPGAALALELLDRIAELERTL